MKFLFVLMFLSINSSVWSMQHNFAVGNNHHQEPCPLCSKPMSRRCAIVCGTTLQLVNNALLQDKKKQPIIERNQQLIQFFNNYLTRPDVSSAGAWTGENK